MAAEDVPGAVVGVVAGELFGPRREDAQLGAVLAVVGFAVGEVVIAAAHFGGDAAAHVLIYGLNRFHLGSLGAGLDLKQHAQGFHQRGLADFVRAFDQGDAVIEFDVAGADAAPVFQSEAEQLHAPRPLILAPPANRYIRRRASVAVSSVAARASRAFQVASA